MSRKKTSQYMVVPGYSVTCGLVNDVRAGKLDLLPIDISGSW